MRFDRECDSCNGTGLYCGMGERDGVAVVCRTCNGKGHYEEIIRYRHFIGRKTRKGVKRVIQSNPGISVSAKLDIGGMSYEDWLRGGKFRQGMEMRQYVCPSWWYQDVDYERKPHWDECVGMGSFSDCKMFKQKQKCWEKFDRLSRRKP